MNKELEALRRIEYALNNADELVQSNYEDDDLDIIETALDQKAKQAEVLDLLFKWFEPQIICEYGCLPRLMIKCGNQKFSYEFENEYDCRLISDLIDQREKTK